MPDYHRIDPDRIDPDRIGPYRVDPDRVDAVLTAVRGRIPPDDRMDRAVARTAGSPGCGTP